MALSKFAHSSTTECLIVNSNPRENVVVITEDLYEYFMSLESVATRAQEMNQELLNLLKEMLMQLGECGDTDNY